jgi:hypothetical protein
MIAWLMFNGTRSSAEPALPAVVALKGQVQVLEKTGTDLPSMIYEGERFYYRGAKIGMTIHEGAVMLCAMDARAKLVYPSGTSIWLSSGSMVKIIKAEKAVAGESSVVDLVYGHLRALVAKPKGATWQVRTKSAIDGVRGTDFVSSYSPVTGHEVTVMSGVVEVQAAGKTSPVEQVKPDESLNEVSPGKFQVEPIKKVQVLSAYEMTVIPPPAKAAEPESQVVSLEAKSRELVANEIRVAQPEVYKAIQDPSKVSTEDLNRKLVEAHLEKAKSANGQAPQKPFTHDLDNYKKLDDGK